MGTLEVQIELTVAITNVHIAQYTSMIQITEHDHVVNARDR